MTLVRLGTPRRSAYDARLTRASAFPQAGETSEVDEQIDESELVRRLVAGDAAAWRTFVDRFHRLVVARVAATARELHIPLRASDGEDLAAEVFLQLVAHDYSTLRDFQGRSSLSTWISVIARRIALRKLLTARREPANPQYAADATVELAGATHDDPLAQLIQGENRRRLADALSELPDRQRELVRLHYVDGCSYREISERLGIPMNSIGPSLQRVQQKLRERMRP